MKSKGNQKLNVIRKKNKIVGDTSRVITRPHLPGNRSRIYRIIGRIVNLSDEAASTLIEKIMNDFSIRHEDIHHIFVRNLNRVKVLLGEDIPLNDKQKILIGAYFTKEYAIESAALFNPSIVPHPNQENLQKGSMRFVMSLRATGEGHISSIVFRSGVLDPKNIFRFDPISEFVETPDLKKDALYDRLVFNRKLNEMWASNQITEHILKGLPEEFNCSELTEQINLLRSNPRFSEGKQIKTFEIINWLADSNYQVTFHSDHRISERVIFPVSKNESSGIEDARFVQFFDNNKMTYYATYTAYNGMTILPQLLETEDFVSFKILTLNGDAVQNKGMALFPRKINGQYVMLSRQDGENNHIMFSDNIHFWQTSQILQKPEYPWEFIQVGNCGSPVETEKGWIVLTHGVGPMRQYCIGAMLLDLDNPCKIIARLEEPLLAPHENEREGYVPNVVYSCGSIIHHNELIIPYAMSDINSGIATISVKNLLKCMKKTDPL